jgi:hypothetical protein
MFKKGFPDFAITLISAPREVT